MHTQPSLPMKPGRAGTMTHDYKRNVRHEGAPIESATQAGGP